MRRIVIVAVLVLAGCGGNAMADEAQYVIDQQPDDVEDTCGGLAKEADSVDDLVAELEAMDGDRRATIMDNFDSRAGDELFEMFAGNDHIANNVVSWPDGDHVATVLPPVRPSRSARPVAGPGSDRVGSTVGGGSGSGRVALGLVPGGGS